jgi:hypothetical protein
MGNQARTHRPQRQIPALTTLARHREPVRRAIHEHFRERTLARRHATAGVVALDETRPLAFFAGIWTRWTSVRKVKEGETTK